MTVRLRPGLPRTCQHSYCESAICEALFDIAQYDITCRAAPLQISGHYSGVPFYFRARHNRWRLEAGSTDPGGQTVANGDTDDFTIGQAIELIEREMPRWIWPVVVESEAGLRLPPAAG